MHLSNEEHDGNSRNLIFIFLAVGLITDAIVETITSTVGWRANTLLNGMKALQNDPNFTGLASDLYHHALINPRGPGVAGTVNSAGITSSGGWNHTQSH